MGAVRLSRRCVSVEAMIGSTRLKAEDSSHIATNQWMLSENERCLSLYCGVGYIVVKEVRKKSEGTNVGLVC